MSSSATFSFDNAVFSAFAFYATVLVVKILSTLPILVYYRNTKKVFINDEDYAFQKLKKATAPDADVERIRRLHANDLENIPLFLFLGMIYVMIGPSVSVALWHFRIYTVARVLFAVCYLFGLQPFRTMTFMVGIFTMMSIIVQIFLYAPF